MIYLNKSFFFETSEYSVTVLPGDSKAINKTLRDIANPGVFLILLVKKYDSQVYEIPAGDTRLNAGDHVILITVAEENGNVVSFFGGSVK